MEHVSITEKQQTKSMHTQATQCPPQSRQKRMTGKMYLLRDAVQGPRLSVHQCCVKSLDLGVSL